VTPPVGQSQDGREARPPNNSLEPTRLAAGKVRVSCPPSCARMRVALPEPPSGSARGR
jgi:hypothetical protein